MCAYKEKIKISLCLRADIKDTKSLRVDKEESLLSYVLA